MKALLFPLLLAVGGTSSLYLHYHYVHFSQCIAAWGVAKAGGGPVRGDGALGSSGGAPSPSSFASTPQWLQLKQTLCPNMTPNPHVRSALFELARKELGFAPARIPISNAADQNFTDAFFAFSSGGVGYASPDGNDHMVYLRVWKAGNNQIRFNLNATLSPKGTVWERQGGLLKALEQGWPGLWSPIPREKLNNTCVVTAVRDPVSHFLSGYNEMEHRVVHEDYHQWETQRHPKPLLFSRYANGTDERFEQFVADFLSGGLYPSTPHWNIYHVFSMTGVLWELKRRADALGLDAPRLTAYLPDTANMDAEFPRMLAEHCRGLPKEAKRDFSLKFEHPSQKDERGFYAAAKRVWGREDRTARALCALHAMDYACFDAIPVPSVCQDVFSGEEFGERLNEAARRGLS